jgi:predicted NBD/HSP70 family sugar kinase
MVNPARVLYVGVDIGGTSVKVGVVDAEGKVLAREQQQLLSDAREPSDVVALTVALVEQLLGSVRSHLALLVNGT